MNPESLIGKTCQVETVFGPIPVLVSEAVHSESATAFIINGGYIISYDAAVKAVKAAAETAKQTTRQVSKAEFEKTNKLYEDFGKQLRNIEFRKREIEIEYLVTRLNASKMYAALCDMEVADDQD